MCSYIGKRKFKSVKKRMKISMKVCEKFQVKCVPISVQESSREQKANERSSRKPVKSSKLIGPYIGETKFKSINKQMKISMKACESSKLNVSLYRCKKAQEQQEANERSSWKPVKSSKLNRSLYRWKKVQKQQEANERSPQKLKGKKTDKNLKTDDVSKSRRLKSRKARVQKPKKQISRKP
jgi:hypothetical protein